MQQYRSTYFNGVTLTPITYSQLASINGSFMLLPNATFYYNSKSIADAVDSANVPYAIYPEREYKKAHAPNKRVGKIVHGHDVTLTYRLATNYVDSIVDGALTATTLPDFKEAVIDKD